MIRISGMQHSVGFCSWTGTVSTTYDWRSSHCNHLLQADTWLSSALLVSPDFVEVEMESDYKVNAQLWHKELELMLHMLCNELLPGAEAYLQAPAALREVGITVDPVHAVHMHSKAAHSNTHSRRSNLPAFTAGMCRCGLSSSQAQCK